MIGFPQKAGEYIVGEKNWEVILPCTLRNIIKRKTVAVFLVIITRIIEEQRKQLCLLESILSPIHIYECRWTK